MEPRVSIDSILHFEKHVDEAIDLEIETDGEKGGIRACIALKRRFPIQVLISVGGGDGSQAFSFIDCDRLRKKFSCSVKSFIEKYGFDGIDGKLPALV